MSYERGQLVMVTLDVYPKPQEGTYIMKKDPEAHPRGVVPHIVNVDGNRVEVADDELSPVPTAE